jgi:hypothetical protein
MTQIMTCIESKSDKIYRDKPYRESAKAMVT